MKRIFATVLGICLAASTTAQAGSFDEIQVSGHCNMANTEILENGPALSVIFNDLFANMPAGEMGDGRNVNKSCNFKVRISFPQNCYLAGMKQIFTGGAIKTKGSSGMLVFNSFLAGKITPVQPVSWPSTQEITPESAASLFTRTTETVLPEPHNCQGKVQFNTRIALRAIRHNIDRETFIGGLDSWDAELAQKLDLVPVWKPCTPRPRR